MASWKRIWRVVFVTGVAALLIGCTPPARSAAQGLEPPSQAEGLASGGIAIDQRLVDDMVSSRLAQEPEVRLQAALENAQRTLTWFLTIMGAAAVVATLLAGVAALFTAQSHRGRSEIFAEVTAAQRNRFESERLLEQARRRVQAVSRRMSSVQAAVIRDLADVRRQMGEEAQSLKQRVTDVYIDAFLVDLAAAGRDNESRMRRYVAIAALGETGDSRHIRYLEAALRREETDENKEALRQAIHKIKERTQSPSGHDPAAHEG
jgi:hypothetical protein